MTEMANGSVLANRAQLWIAARKLATYDWRMRRTLLVGLLCVSGCGAANPKPDSIGTVSTPTPATAPSLPIAKPTHLSHHALVKRMDRLCVRYNGWLKKRPASYTYTAAAKELDYENRHAPPFDAPLHRLRPPPADRRSFDQYVTAVHRQDALDHRLVKAYEANDQTAVTTLKGLSSALQKPKITAAIDLGLRKCGDAG